MAKLDKIWRGLGLALRRRLVLELLQRDDELARPRLVRNLDDSRSAGACTQARGGERGGAWRGRGGLSFPPCEIERQNLENYTVSMKNGTSELFYPGGSSEAMQLAWQRLNYLLLLRFFSLLFFAYTQRTIRARRRRPIEFK